MTWRKNNIDKFVSRHRALFATILALMLIKVIWVEWSCRDNGSFEEEKADLLQRRNFLVEKQQNSDT